MEIVNVSCALQPLQTGIPLDTRHTTQRLHLIGSYWLPYHLFLIAQNNWHCLYWLGRGDNAPLLLRKLENTKLYPQVRIVLSLTISLSGVTSFRAEQETSGTERLAEAAAAPDI